MGLSSMRVDAGGRHRGLWAMLVPVGRNLRDDICGRRLLRTDAQRGTARRVIGTDCRIRWTFPEHCCNARYRLGASIPAPVWLTVASGQTYLRCHRPKTLACARCIRFLPTPLHTPTAATPVVSGIFDALSRGLCHATALYHTRATTLLWRARAHFDMPCRSMLWWRQHRLDDLYNLPCRCARSRPYGPTT